MAAGSHVAYPVVSKARSRAVSLAGIAISRSLMKSRTGLSLRGGHPGEAPTQGQSQRWWR
jgi:hypothetical protein